MASPAFVVAVEADDAALSADFPAAVALAAAPLLMDASRPTSSRCLAAAAEALCPLPFRRLSVRLGRFCRLRNFLPPLPRSALLALDDAFVSDDFAAL
ncbi:hypothetical protein H6S20_11565 [Escherichia coli]|nr:hypothetical protein H6S20_11565 [Escherichia coli]